MSTEAVKMTMSRFFAHSGHKAFIDCLLCEQSKPAFLFSLDPPFWTSVTECLRDIETSHTTYRYHKTYVRIVVRMYSANLTIPLIER